MALQIDRVHAEMQILRKPEGSGTTSGDLAFSGGDDRVADQHDALVRRLRPVVIDILREHLRELERRGTL